MDKRQPPNSDAQGKAPPRGQKKPAKTRTKSTTEATAGLRTAPSSSMSTVTLTSTTEGIDEPFLIVGIGASTGGLDAFKQLLQAMPKNPGMALVLVQHLDPTQDCVLPELLAKYTSMQVVQAQDGMPVHCNTVYTIPPNKYLYLEQGKLRLTVPTARRGMRLPIDFLFQSLAHELGEAAMGIVLSGNGVDGTQGIRAIKAKGGTVFAQQPASATDAGMPESAIATGLVDVILVPSEIPQALQGFIAYVHAMTSYAPSSSPADLQAILTLLHERTQHDFRCYKQGTLTRRIHRRMVMRQVESYPQYLSLLRAEAAEVEALLRDLLIGVTCFFRDQEAWTELEQQTLTRLLQKKTSQDILRVWVPACSSGEEPYTIAMLISELQSQLGIDCGVQIFASDIDDAALEKARAAIYPPSIVANLPQERLHRFFHIEDGQYHIKKHIRDMVVFASQNLLRDPPFSRLDLICCRNLLIYLDSSTQRRVIAMLHFALKIGGYLFLGPSESIAHQDDLFEAVSKKWRIYRRIGVARKPVLEFPFFSGDNERPAPRMVTLPKAHRDGSISALAHEILLSEYVPTSVIVNRHGEALYYHGPVANYLEVVAGEPTLDIANQIRNGMKLKFRSALQRAIRERTEVTVSGRMRERSDTESSRAVTIRVRPLQAPASAEGLILITFEEVKNDSSPAEPVTELLIPEEAGQLEYELMTTREDLQSTIEELETSNEELKASNEEVMSMNEELQSANEELETSKEELQSLNEELTTVNNQLQDKIQDLEIINNDMNNLLNGTSVATLFLDRDAKVRRFTPQVRRLFRLIPSDVGRDLEDIALRFHDRKILQRIKQVMTDLTPTQHTVEAEDGGTFLCSIMPYRTQDERVDGVVLNFSDISNLKQIEAEFRASEERFRSFMDNSPAISWINDEQGRHIYLSQVYQQRFNLKNDEWIGKTDAEVWPAKIADTLRQNDLAVLSNGKTIQAIEVTKDARGNSVYWQSFRFLVHDGSGNRYVGGMAVDITKQVTIENELRSSLARIEQSHQEMEFVATHDELTRLPNRALFYAQLDNSLANRARSGVMLTVMFIDLDNFKQINDGLGHDMGDKLLQEAARRLVASVRDGDLAARIGGDEFAVLMDNSDKLQAAEIAQRILESLSRPYWLANKELLITASIGIGIAPDDGADSQTILKSADFAMYQVKGSGRSDYQFYSRSTAEAAHRRMELLLELRRAIAGKGLYLEYQPEICLSTGALVGVEALIRWQHPSGRVLGPDEYIHLAEEHGLIVALGECVLDMACQQMATWIQNKVAIPRVSVNLSSRHFLHGNLHQAILNALEKYHIKGDTLALGIEVTEYALLNSTSKVDIKQLLGDLKKLGVNIAIDDFGTGYSSLAYLKHYPIDELKIDKSFIDGIAQDPEDAVITAAILAMAEALGVRCVAEGVETEDQLRILREQGCDIAQGYLIGKPMSAEALCNWIRTRDNARPKDRV